MMDQAIKDFPKQFNFKPEIENLESLKSCSKFVVCGMGGSGHAADVIKLLRPNLDIIVHRDYGLPTVDISDRLIIASSYSGNTEEVIDAFHQALERSLLTAAVSIGGKLLTLAQEKQAPYITLPDTGIQPRSALGFSFIALLKFFGEQSLLDGSTALAKMLKSKNWQRPGRELTRRVKGKVPIIYCSTRNYAVGNNWKIKLNETAKVPAFLNVFPELNHNEMNGFDFKEKSRKLSKNFYFIFLRDSNDHPRVQTRMAVLADLLQQRGLPTENIELTGETPMEKIFNSLLLADWFSFYTAKYYQHESEQVPMVEEFKKLIK